MKQMLLSTSVAAALGMVSMSSQAVNQFELLSGSGTPVALVCQGVQEPVTSGSIPEPATPDFCRLIGGAVPTATACQNATNFPGLGSAGGFWIRIRQSNNQNIVLTGRGVGGGNVTIGTMDDRVWQRCSAKASGATLLNDYILGLKININTNDWVEPADDNMGLPGTNGCNGETVSSFEVNDVFRRGGANTSSDGGFFNITNVYTAYFRGVPSAEEGVWRSGRTEQGLAYLKANNPTNPLAALIDPARNNNWVSWRTDVSPEDPDAFDPGASSWMFTRVTLAAGQSIPTSKLTNAIRIEQGSEEGQCAYRVQMPGYRPTP